MWNMKRTLSLTAFRFITVAICPTLQQKKRQYRRLLLSRTNYLVVAWVIMTVVSGGTYLVKVKF